MDCCHKHVNDDLVYLKCENNRLKRLKVEVGAAGLGNPFQKHFVGSEWVLRHNRCNHLQDVDYIKYPIFYCYDGKLRCLECLNEENIEIATPLMKNDNPNEYGNDILLQLPFTYEPHNLEFSFDCDSTGIKGEKINGKIIIKNNKKHPIREIKLSIESFAVPPWDGNKPYGRYYNQNSSKMIFFKEFIVDLIESNDILEISTKIRIPKDNEIQKNQLFNNLYGETSNDDENDYLSISENSSSELLKIPDNLMIFAKFDYKTVSGYKYNSAIETETVNIR